MSNSSFSNSNFLTLINILLKNNNGRKYLDCTPFIKFDLIGVNDKYIAVQIKIQTPDIKINNNNLYHLLNSIGNFSFIAKNNKVNKLIRW